MFKKKCLLFLVAYFSGNINVSGNFFELIFLKMKALIVLFIYLFTHLSSKATYFTTNLFSQLDSTVLKEFFVDSINVGRKKYNKIELVQYSVSDSNYVIIKFYSRLKNKTWKLKQTFSFEKDDVLSLDTELSDFNNDGFKDMTYISNIAARGANQVRRLFIYDNILDKLIYMKNSEDYPNMLYNKKLNCIDAFLVYGGSSTIFLNIKGDSLVEFAGVDLDDHITVYEINKSGKRIIIKKQKNKDEWYYVRFKSYKPLVSY